MSERPIQSTTGATLSREEIACNFEDLHTPLDAGAAGAEAERCLYCYDAPCVRACPTSIDIPKFMHQIRTENVSGAAKTILDANIMGGTCARACPTEILCEQACVRNTSEDKPVEIGLLQRFAVDSFMNEGAAHPFERGAETGKKVAVIGAGPAGLSAAHRLARLGHTVTVYEAQPKPGGLNEYGLAAYKMVNDFAQKEVDFLLEIGGIEIKHGQRLGRDMSLGDLQNTYDAVFIGAGLGGGRQARVEGENLPGIRKAIDFISDLRSAAHPADVKVPNNVVVIGGGNTAVDAAIQAKRLGAEVVTMVYRRGAPHMSATEWEQDLALQNGVTVRHWSAPLSFEGRDVVESVRFSRTELGTDGKLMDAGSPYSVPAELVLMAIGQTLLTGDLEGLKVEDGKLVVDAEYQTTVAGVFAGGDCVATGDDLTVQAVEDGKQAAYAIHKYLGFRDADSTCSATAGHTQV